MLVKIVINMHLYVCVNISCTVAASIFDSRLMALIGSLEKHQGVPLQCAAAIKERAEPSMRCVVDKKKKLEPSAHLCPIGHAAANTGKVFIQALETKDRA